MRRNVMVLVSAVLALLLLGSTVVSAATVPVAGVGGTLFSSPIPPPLPGACSRYHLVRVGETLYSIGRLYGVSASAIAVANHLANLNWIRAGQWLCIPRGGTVPPPGCARYHVVRWGQTLYSIGRMYGVSPWVIASANGIYNINWIYVGQRLFIPCRPY